VLIVGGLSGGFSGNLTPADILASAELFDPASGSWTSTGTLADPRFNFTATVLLDGKVIAVAGDHLGSGPVISSELYDPGTGSWAPASPMIEARAAHTATILPSGEVLVAGGEGPGAVGLASAEVYRPRP
jgi:hypothetical protein